MSVNGVSFCIVPVPEMGLIYPKNRQSYSEKNNQPQILLSLSRNRLLGRKETIWRFVMVILSPVRGFLPRRGDLSRTERVPNCTNLTDSPATMVSFITEKTVSTISAAFRCESPSFSLTEMASSFRVTFFFFILLILLGNGHQIFASML